MFCSSSCLNTTEQSCIVFMFVAHYSIGWRWHGSTDDERYQKILKLFQDKKNSYYYIHQIGKSGTVLCKINCVLCLSAYIHHFNFSVVSQYNFLKTLIIALTYSHMGATSSSTRADIALSDQRDRMRQKIQKGERIFSYRHTQHLPSSLLPINSLVL